MERAVAGVKCVVQKIRLAMTIFGEHCPRMDVHKNLHTMKIAFHYVQTRLQLHFRSVQSQPQVDIH